MAEHCHPYTAGQEHPLCHSRDTWEFLKELFEKEGKALKRADETNQHLQEALSDLRQVGIESTAQKSQINSLSISLNEAVSEVNKLNSHIAVLNNTVKDQQHRLWKISGDNATTQTYLNSSAARLSNFLNIVQNMCEGNIGPQFNMEDAFPSTEAKIKRIDALEQVLYTHLTRQSEKLQESELEIQKYRQMAEESGELALKLQTELKAKRDTDQLEPHREIIRGPSRSERRWRRGRSHGSVASMSPAPSNQGSSKETKHGNAN